MHAHREQNVLVRGRVVCGDVEKALAEADVVVEGEYETGFVEHAYIEPEAGFARRVGDRIEIQACTQSPYMDRHDIAKILGIASGEGTNHSDGGRRRIWIEARSFSAAVCCAGCVETGATGAHGVLANRIDYRRRPSGIPHACACALERRGTANSRRSTFPQTSTRARIRPGDRRLRGACRCMLQGRTAFHTTGR